MRASDVRRAASSRLRGSGVASPERDAELLLAHVLDVPLGRLPLVEDLTEDQLDRYDGLVARRCAREPLQHLTGSAAFRHVELLVGPGVFVPRPETELLAGWAVDRARALDGTPVVVDLCTGSGAIAKAVADEVPAARVHAVELDPRAYAWAAENLGGGEVDLRQGDLADAFADLDGTVDVVVCNPPYIPLVAFEGVDVEARTHEPDLALFSGDDGLDAIRVLERTAARLLVPGGWLGFEHASEQGRAAPAVLERTGRWRDVRDHADLLDRPRFTTARLRG